MASFVSDGFVESGSDVLLENHTGGLGATWTLRSTLTATVNSNNDYVVKTDGTVGMARYHTSGIPPSAEYDVSVALRVVDATKSGSVGITGRYSTSAQTYYVIRNNNNTGFSFYKVIAGVYTYLGQYLTTLNTGQVFTIRLEIRNAYKKVFIDSVERISVSDNSITDAGRAGVELYIGVQDNQGGYALDNFVASTPDSGGAAWYYMNQ